MVRKAKKGEIIILDNDREYIVSGKIEFGGEDYLLIKRLKDLYFDMLDKKKAEVEFVREVVENDEYILEEVLDKDLLKSLISEGMKVVGDK